MDATQTSKMSLPSGGRHRRICGAGFHQGFTLVELLVGLVVGLIAIGAVYSVFIVYQKQYRHQRSRIVIQQNLRGAMAVLEQEIRMAGFDPEESGRFGIVDVRRYDLIGTKPDADGQPALFYTVDLDENGAPDERNHYHNKEHPNFRIRFDRSIGRRYLAWDNGGGRRPLAENIECIGLAYAIDVDGDGRRDTWAGGPYPIWAVDTDNDNRLDTHLDANNDGRIDERDDTDNDRRITSADGGVLSSTVSLDRIRSVRIWLLGISSFPSESQANQRLFVVGDRLVEAGGDGFVRRVLENVVECRNHNSSME